MAGLLVVLGRLLGVERALFGISGEQRIGRVDREVVAERAVAEQDLVDHLLAVHGIFQRQPQVVVVEGRRVAQAMNG